MAAVQAVQTTAFRNKLAQTFARSGPKVDPRKLPAQFKIGEGGYVVVAGTKQPVAPSPSRMDLESEGTSIGGASTVTNGSANVMGAGTNYVADLTVNQWVKLPGGDLWGQVQSIADATHMQLVGPWLGATTVGTTLRKGNQPYFTFRKLLADADVFEDLMNLNKTQVECFALSAEANDNGFGGAPQFFELGVFDSDALMMGYATFPQETKVAGLNLRHHVRLVW